MRENKNRIMESRLLKKFSNGRNVFLTKQQNEEINKANESLEIFINENYPELYFIEHCNYCNVYVIRRQFVLYEKSNE